MSRFDEQLGSIRVEEAMEVSTKYFSVDLVLLVFFIAGARYSKMSSTPSPGKEMDEKSGAWLYVRFTPVFIFQSPDLMSSWAASERRSNGRHGRNGRKIRSLVVCSFNASVHFPKSRFDEQLGSIRVGETMEDMEVSTKYFSVDRVLLVFFLAGAGYSRMSSSPSPGKEMAEKSGAWLYVRLTPVFIFQSPDLMSSWAASEWRSN